MKKNVLLLFCLLTIELADARLYIATQNIPIRNSKRHHSLLLGFLTKDATVDVTNIHGTWGMVKYQGKDGYVKIGRLKIAPPPAPRPAVTNKANSTWPAANTILLWIAAGLGALVIIRISLIAKKKFSNKTGRQKNSASKSNIAPPVYWYQCKHCGAVVKKGEFPSNDGCIKSKLHQWTQLAEVGPRKYMCKQCLTTIRAKTAPVSSGCPRGEIHTWNEI